MLAGRRAVRAVPVPGFEAKEGEEVPTVGVRILTESELDEARIDAQLYIVQQAKKRQLEARDLLELDAELLDREIWRATILRAFIALDVEEQPGKEPPRFFESYPRVRALDSVLLVAFWELYKQHQNYVNPYRSLSDDEAKELADALSKGQIDPVILALYDAASLRRLVRSLVSPLATSPTGS